LSPQSIRSLVHWQLRESVRCLRHLWLAERHGLSRRLLHRRNRLTSKQRGSSPRRRGAGLAAERLRGGRAVVVGRSRGLRAEEVAELGHRRGPGLPWGERSRCVGGSARASTPRPGRTVWRGRSNNNRRCWRRRVASPHCRSGVGLVVPPDEKVTLAVVDGSAPQELMSLCRSIFSDRPPYGGKIARTQPRVIVE
jgi:hypothetical protein